uniref:uncharacterized protein LOC100177520 n=1 Tax=Ciona intestinalis TaxID=7719 RepID=UPI000180BCC8|nr:uncharacterized protein LOC100177520 [Ciona intestinalis]|eukprot:XP_009861480.1 uncharacterized protein LOC100177520 [Ciona intestinalis]
MSWSATFMPLITAIHPNVKCMWARDLAGNSHMACVGSVDGSGTPAEIPESQRSCFDAPTKAELDVIVKSAATEVPISTGATIGGAGYMCVYNVDNMVGFAKKGDSNTQVVVAVFKTIAVFAYGSPGIKVNQIVGHLSATKKYFDGINY